MAASRTRTRPTVDRDDLYKGARQNTALKLAQEAAVLNKQIRDLSSKSRRKEAELAKMMAQYDLPPLEFTIPWEGGEIPYRAAIATGVQDVVDVALLRESVEEADFMNLIKSTKTAVQDHGGKALAAKVLRTEVTEAKLRVTEVK